MRVIIAGSRGIEDYTVVVRAMADCGFAPTEVVSGTARGADRLGERWAAACGIPVHRMPADWATHGRRAGFLRNEEMARYAVAGPPPGGLVALWDGESPGTRAMIALAHRYGLRVHVETVRREATGPAPG